MKLAEILKTVDAKRPNEFNEEVKICFINSIIRQFGKIIGKSAVYEFEAEEGVCKYPLPKGEEGDGVKAVFVDDERYNAADIDEGCGEGEYIIMPAGYISIKAPAGKTVKIIHNACKPFEDFENGGEYLKEDCGAYDSYADILVYGVLYQMAECEEDINAAQNYKEQMNEMLKAAKQSRYLKRGRYPVVKETGRKWNRR